MTGNGLGGLTGILIGGLVALLVAGIVIVVEAGAIAEWIGTRTDRRAQRKAASLTAGQRCDRCATGDTRLTCACTTDCGAPTCLGWFAALERDVMRGDA